MIAPPPRGYSAVILSDPELALESDTMPGGPLVVVGTWSQLYLNAEAMLADRTAREADLARGMDAWQRHVEPGGYAVREIEFHGEDVTIYIELIDADQAYQRELASGADRDEAEALRRRVVDASERGWLWGRHYSSIVPGGEYGAVHRAHLDHLINEDEFTAARDAGWP